MTRWHNRIRDAMTIEEVRERIRAQAGDGREINHGISLAQALMPPQKISVIERTVKDGRLKDRNLSVWLVGEEPSPGGYKIIMREDGMNFGLASPGFPRDPHPILTGWYGSLMSAFLGM